MDARSVLLSACLAAAVGGCGGDGEPRAERPLEPVALTIAAPADMATVRGESVEVSGSVEPAEAEVLVVGQRAHVTAGGRFNARVPLEPGANVIDVMASARGRDPALTAFRVVREVPVEVPDLDGMDVPAAQDAVAAVALELEVEERGGLFEELLGGEPAVCEQDPEPGTDVRRGTAVHVVISKSC